MVKELRAAARHLPRDSGQLRLLRCTLAPADELCIWAFEADSEATVRALGHAVGLELDRISLAVDVWPLPRWSRR